MCNELRVWLPKELKKQDMIDAVSFALHNLAFGEKAPECTWEGARIQTRIKLSEKGKEYFDELRPRYKSNTDLIIAALAWLAEKPAWMRTARV